MLCVVVFCCVPALLDGLSTQQRVNDGFDGLLEILDQYRFT